MNTTRICICIDLDTQNIEVAYRKVYDAMTKTGLEWESSDEWFYGDGKDIPEFVISEARMRVLDAQVEPTKTPIDYVCDDCGGSEISVEAMVEFSPWNQEFIVHDTCDKGHYCSTCDGTCSLKEVDYFGDLDPAIASNYRFTAAHKPVLVAEPEATPAAIHHDFEEALGWVWAALHDYRENSIPEHDPMYDDQWDDICTGMAWIREGLGLPDLVDVENNQED